MDDVLAREEGAAQENLKVWKEGRSVAVRQGQAQDIPSLKSCKNASKYICANHHLLSHLGEDASY